jgi:hypothetical protein
MFNVGVLYAIQKFLDIIHNKQIRVKEFKESFPEFNYIKNNHILYTSRKLNWTTLDGDNNIVITDKGYDIVSIEEPYAKLRLQLKDIFYYDPPEWSPLLCRGRKAVIERRLEISCSERIWNRNYKS